MSTFKSGKDLAINLKKRKEKEGDAEGVVGVVGKAITTYSDCRSAGYMTIWYWKIQKNSAASLEELLITKA